MDSSIASILLLDGATNGSIYALLGLALVLVFAVTRVIFIPQGEFVAYGALTLALLQLGRVPGTIWLLVALAAVAVVLDLADGARRGLPAATMLRGALATLLAPLVVAGLTWWAAPLKLHLFIQCLLTLAIVTLLGPLVYRIAYQRLADATVLVLLIGLAVIAVVLDLADAARRGLPAATMLPGALATLLAPCAVAAIA